jgi:hypothetical protein
MFSIGCFSGRLKRSFYESSSKDTRFRERERDAYKMALSGKEIAVSQMLKMYRRLKQLRMG